MKKLNPNIKSLEERLKQELNSELPVKDKELKIFLYNMLKGYRSIKEEDLESTKEAEQGIASAKSDINLYMESFFQPITKPEKLSYAVGQLIKFSILYQKLNNEK